METAFDRVEPPPAGFWIRFGASVIDTAILLTTQLALRLASWLVWGGGIGGLPLFEATLNAFMLVLSTAYFVVLHALFGQTAGKMAAGIRVVELHGRPLSLGTAFLRWLGYLLSALTLGLGFVIAGVRRDKRALHDFVASTRVIRLAREGSSTEV
jgi:uncharacterized RDD family membrane protein YckC